MQDPPQNDQKKAFCTVHIRQYLDTNLLNLLNLNAIMYDITYMQAF